MIGAVQCRRLEWWLSVRVAVVDPLPMFRYGIAALLAAAGHEVDTPADAFDWAMRHKHGTVLLTVESEVDWTLLTELAQMGSLAVIAMLPAPAGARGADAVRAGAASVIGRSASPEALLRVMAALSAGEATLPLDVVRVLAAEPDESPDDADRPPPEQVTWLQALANGSTVAALANDAGYSERAMFRLLRALYERLGARTRTEALMRAHQRGWLRG
jgi:DNA-binding NarL/FixJ family response regulator